VTEAPPTELPPAAAADPATNAPAGCAEGCPVHRLGGSLIGLAGWLAAAVAACSVALIPYTPGEEVCGVWGCFPPLSALAAMHLLWCVALGAGVWAVGRWAPALRRPVGVVLLLASVGATAALVGNDVVRWIDGIPDGYRRFWPRRIAYRVSTLTDVPLVQSFLLGVWCLVRRR
jgi:hypothetical protein